MPDLKRNRTHLSPASGSIPESTLIEELKSRKGNNQELLDYVMGLIGETPNAKQMLFDTNVVQPFLSSDIDADAID